MDNRYLILTDRLNSLHYEELKRLRRDIDKVCLDTYNYDKSNNTYCPLAIALNLHNTVDNPTNELILEILSERFNPVNVIGGVEGDFYTGDHRKEDLIQVLDELITEHQAIY